MTKVDKVFDAEFELRDAAAEYADAEASKWDTAANTRIQRNIRRKRLRDAALAFAAQVDSFGLRARVQ